MAAYYNEFDPDAAAWLRAVIARGLIAPGFVDERSIEDVRPDDLAGFTQCHFFAGIGVWSWALRRAGWPDDRPVWTGSCPCQPFSAAGKGGGFDDERHLWPAWFWLIGQRRPPVVLGEQVASKDGLGWLDLVQSDLEGADYAGGALDLCAAGFGAPHIRQRLYFCAYDSRRAGALADDGVPRLAERVGDGRVQPDAMGASERQTSERGGRPSALANLPGGHAGAERQQRGGEQRFQSEGDGAGALAGADEGQRGRVAGPGGGDVEHGPAAGREQGDGGAAGGGRVGGLADRAGGGRGERGGAARSGRGGYADGGLAADRPGPTNGFWRDADWLYCRDEKWRPVEPGLEPLVDGAPARMVRLRGYGNAIVAPQAQVFIEAAKEALSDVGFAI